MICRMQWQEGETILDVSEVTTDNKIGISMQDEDNVAYGHYISLEKHDVVRLIEWLTKSLEDFQE